MMLWLEWSWSLSDIIASVTRMVHYQMLVPRRRTEGSEDDLEAHQHKDAEPLLFNIERDGDPRISWIMYYDFVVTKSEAFYELKPGYLATANYPSRRNTEEIISNDKKVYPCRVPNCKSKPFARHHDLERHFKIHRGDDEHFNCDYKKYPHKEPFRKDHCREQYREYHAEDLIKRCQPHYSNPKHSQKKSEKKSEMVEDFLASRLDNINLDWWRCSKCAQRVQVNDHGYTCPKCSIACELERIALGEKDSISRNPGLDMETTERLSTEEKTSLMVQEIAWQRYGSILTSLEDHGEKFSVEITSFDCRCFFWYKAFYPASLIAGFSMMGLFLWSNQRMELETSSDFVQQIVAAYMRAIPVQVVRASHLVLSSLIPVSYLLASAIWSISTLGWIATRLRSPCLGQWYIYILLATTFWAFQGVTAAELFLAFLPLSVSIGVCLYTICGGPIVNPPTCKRCARGQDGYERPTSIAVPPIQDPYSRKSALEVSRQDLEIIVKG